MTRPEGGERPQGQNFDPSQMGQRPNGCRPGGKDSNGAGNSGEPSLEFVLTEGVNTFGGITNAK